MITDPLFYLFAIPAVLIFGMAKGGFGGGISIIAVPLMAMTVPPIQAAAILLPLLVAMDFVALWSFRGQWSKTNIKMTLPGALLGILIGTFTFHYLSEDAIRILIGIIAVAFCMSYWLKRENKVLRSPDIFQGSFWGCISGFTSFGIHSGGAPISIYFLPQQMEKKLLMGTFAVFFTVVNLFKLIPYAWLGQFDSTNLMTSLALLPAAPIGVRLGYYLLHKIDEVSIYRLAHIFLFIMGLKLLWDGTTNTLH